MITLQRHASAIVTLVMLAVSSAGAFGAEPPQLWLTADGVFLPGGRFVALPRVPADLLAEGFRRAVLDFLVKNEIHSIQPGCACRALADGIDWFGN